MIRALVLAIVLASSAPAHAAEVAAPPEHRRGADQTFLTFPEWFLVFSPAEYAEYVETHPPTGFPFIGHVRQFWQGYARVNDAIREYPFNFGYHVMVMVIGVSTTIEYALRAAYETTVGRLSELTMRHGLTAEDRYGARVAREYVDFIRVQPWYEFDFAQRLAGLWRETSLWGPDLLRKWERKYALTTEYGIKAAYGWLIGLGTKASYDAPLPVTAVVVDKLPEGLDKRLPATKVLGPTADGGVLLLLPRYDAFMRDASALALAGAQFREIAGNRGDILVTVIAPAGAGAGPGQRVLFEQPILTQPPAVRFALVVPVASLGDFLRSASASGVRVEHVFDY